MRRSVLLFVVVFLLLFGPTANARDIAGVVSSVSGTWFADGTKINLGQALTVGTVVKAREPNLKYARVVVTLLDYNEVSSVCDRHGRCPDSLRLPDVVQRLETSRSFDRQRTTFWQRLILAINKSTGPRFRRTLTRGGSSLSDQVIRVQKDRIDLEVVFNGLAPGDFVISMERLDDEGKRSSAWAVERQPLKWTGDGPLILRDTNLVPGLYEISFTQPIGSRNVLPTNVWVLLLESSRYKRLSAEYQTTKQITKEWDRRTNPQADEVMRSFLVGLWNDAKP